jgi:hypothetical protein
MTDESDGRREGGIKHDNTQQLQVHKSLHLSLSHIDSHLDYINHRIEINNTTGKVKQEQKHMMLQKYIVRKRYHEQEKKRTLREARVTQRRRTKEAGWLNGIAMEGKT